MRNANPFGRAGRSRSVHDICQAFRRTQVGQIFWAERVQQRLVLIEQNGMIACPTFYILRQRSQPAFFAHQRLNVGILNHERQALLGISWIQG